ncbi:unnamed protein product [Rotaria sp. Silwood2]|nr:unnamed protein product [Rotaria sp. Silwood2]CAF2512239.1 unnamed protein product [Rotaria sp. Silwood2]CAF2873184.1 unnamed protein product [Rotaria sp. Silwood2]CAF3944935.1 unnamed protein product [Rotaria sp. Silwood2]CAF4050872.1 unnamed protein product [Rotaria sp. Silwood2]
MATPPSEPPLPKSRGHSLFDRQAHLHANDRDKSSSSTIFDTHKPLTPLKTVHSIPLPPSTTSPVTHLPYQYAPLQMNVRAPLSSTETYAHSKDNNVQLIGIHPRPESNYIKDPLPPSTSSSKLQETDFPLYEHPTVEESEKIISENISSTDTTCTTVVEKLPNYSPTYDDDDDVIHQENDDEQEYSSESFDDEDEYNSVNTNDHDTTAGIQSHQNDSGIHTISSTGNSDKLNDNQNTQETLNDYQLGMASSTRGAVIEEYDSDFDNSSPEEDEQLTHKDSINDYDEEQQNQLILRQQQVLWGIVQEWSKKEDSYCDELKKMAEQLNQISIPSSFQSYIQKLVDQHDKVYREIEDFFDRDRQPATLTKYLTHAVETLMGTLPIYTDYIKTNLVPIRKLLDKRTNTNVLSSEDLLSIPPKQFLQILSQVQDLYQTAQSFETGDMDNISRLYNYAQTCKLYGSRQDENINKVILKTEDVVTMAARGHRERCRLILYPDAIVCCNLKSKLLASPKYMLVWYIPMLDLQWTIPQNPSDDTVDTGDELKTNLKSVYKELEKTTKNNNMLASRLSRNIRKQENEFNLVQSKLQLILSNPRISVSSTILFSSAYQLQDWVDLIDRTKQELIQRSSSAVLNEASHHQRLNESIIQKRLDLIKPNLHESNTNESASNIQTITPSKTYSGTLCITIHNIQGSALYNPTRQYQTLPMMSSVQQQMQKNYQFYVAVEIDSYNTFYPYAKTGTQIMQKPELVEFKGEVFHIELEYSLAFRFLIYRIDSSTTDIRNSSQKEVCIGKFHRDIETALHECQNNANEVTFIESPSGDLKLKFSLNYAKREGTFKRRPSKRSLAVFGKSIEKLLSLPNGHINGIPRIIVKCIEMVEREGLNETGIYRVCCVASDLQKLRNEFDRNYRHGEEMLLQKNVHVAANLLKLFFRELPEPLFSSTLYKEFLHAIQLTDIDNQRVTLLKTFESLHLNNRKILFYLFDHLIRVSQYSHINMMHLDNLAVVFGPTLMRPSKLLTTTNYSGSNQRLNTITNNTNSSTIQTDVDQMSSELQGSMYQCQVVLACLKLRRDEILK